MEEMKKRHAMARALLIHNYGEMKINDRTVRAQQQDGNIHKKKPFRDKDTNSKYLSFKSLWVDGFPCTLQ